MHHELHYCSIRLILITLSLSLYKAYNLTFSISRCAPPPLFEHSIWAVPRSGPGQALARKSTVVMSWESTPPPPASTPSSSPCCMYTLERLTAWECRFCLGPQMAQLYSICHSIHVRGVVDSWSNWEPYSIRESLSVCLSVCPLLKHLEFVAHT